MRTALIHSPSTEDKALVVGSIMTTKGCGVEYFNIKRIWDSAYCRNPVQVLDSKSHLVYISDGDSDDLSSFLFFAGMALGKGIRVIVVEIAKGLVIPENIRHLGVVLKPEEFEDFIYTEIERFRIEDKKAHARRILLDRGISCFDENFIMMVTSGDAESVSLFLDAGFDPSLTDAKGTPVLSLAVRAQFPKVVSRLIDAGADINRLSHDRGYSPLMDAVQKNDAAIAGILLERGADPDIRSKDGQTALVVATGRGDADMCSLLLAHGASPDIKDSLGMSSKDYARLFKNEKLLELFNHTSS